MGENDWTSLRWSKLTWKGAEYVIKGFLVFGHGSPFRNSFFGLLGDDQRRNLDDWKCLEFVSSIQRSALRAWRCSDLWCLPLARIQISSLPISPSLPLCIALQTPPPPCLFPSLFSYPSWIEHTLPRQGLIFLRKCLSRLGEAIAFELWEWAWNRLRPLLAWTGFGHFSIEPRTHGFWLITLFRGEISTNGKKHDLSQTERDTLSTQTWPYDGIGKPCCGP